MSHPDNEAEHLTRADGSVIVPATVSGDVLRALVRDLTARVRADGGEVAPGIRRLLYALHTAAQRVELFDSVTAPFEPAATGTTPDPSGTVCVAETAVLMGCTPRYIRALIAAGRLPAERVGARVWAIDADALDHYRHRRGVHAA
ncbi:excisionase family DNA-binding protein [Streptomyces noursei]|uniref:excisionase family DNA-binding protein n=1 Tax=Streptomyces noursei TaxID=1971 RepID=UPI0019645B12|nr:excisionase family DNA-binding protein [Streptomyces noursei]QRX90851.1 excisionase family DNA-binding protein [Streptomyces noursei]